MAVATVVDLSVARLTESCHVIRAADREATGATGA